MTNKIKDGSKFGVVVKPEFGEDGKWTGNIEAFLTEELKQDLNEEEIIQLRTVCGMMASTLPLMESDVDFLEYLKDFYFDNFSDVTEELEDKSKGATFMRSEDGKVITLDFSTKTHGSA